MKSGRRNQSRRRDEVHLHNVEISQEDGVVTWNIEHTGESNAFNCVEVN